MKVQTANEIYTQRCSLGKVNTFQLCKILIYNQMNDSMILKLWHNITLKSKRDQWALAQMSFHPLTRVRLKVQNTLGARVTNLSKKIEKLKKKKRSNRINICRKLCTIHRNQVTYQFQENEQSLSKKISCPCTCNILTSCKIDHT